jgi:Tfp pilus assembly protein PilF
MRKTIAAAVLLLALAGLPAWAASAKDEARAQVQFGIEVAQRGLWKEALYRWEKAVELDPKYVAAYNNLAVAYEHEGQFEKARRAYETALSLDPKNSYVKQNYEYFKEINDRASRRLSR